jgi:hypothetical protein
MRSTDFNKSSAATFFLGLLSLFPANVNAQQGSNTITGGARFANVLSNTPRVILQTSGFLSYPAVNL